MINKHNYLLASKYIHVLIPGWRCIMTNTIPVFLIFFLRIICYEMLVNNLLCIIPICVRTVVYLHFVHDFVRETVSVWWSERERERERERESWKLPGLYSSCTYTVNKPDTKSWVILLIFKYFSYFFITYFSFIFLLTFCMIFLELCCYSCFDVSYSTECNTTIQCPSVDHASIFYKFPCQVSKFISHLLCIKHNVINCIAISLSLIAKN